MSELTLFFMKNLSGGTWGAPRIASAVKDVCVPVSWHRALSTRGSSGVHDK